MPGYPGEQPRRWPYAVLAVAVALGAGLWAGRATAGRHGASATTSDGGVVCPGSRDAAGRHAAAACLIQAYFTLGRAPDRNARLADLVVSGQLDAARRSYKSLDAKIATEYAAVAATNVQGSGSDVTGQAWVAFVDSYRDGSPPLAQWWITSFGMHWQNGRWRLSGGVNTRADATPQTAPNTSTTGFGPGWVAAGDS